MFDSKSVILLRSSVFWLTGNARMISLFWQIEISKLIVLNNYCHDLSKLFSIDKLEHPEAYADKILSTGLLESETW